MVMRIIFNGKEYSSPEDMPADVRQAYDEAMAQLADADRNGIPDILEQGPKAGNVIGIQQSAITVNGRTYTNVEEMPWYVRGLYERAMAEVDANRDGIPDALQPGGSGAEIPTSPTGEAQSPFSTGVRYEFKWGGDAERLPGVATESGLRPGLLLWGLLLIGLLVLLFWWL